MDGRSTPIPLAQQIPGSSSVPVPLVHYSKNGKKYNGSKSLTLKQRHEKERLRKRLFDLDSSTQAITITDVMDPVKLFYTTFNERFWYSTGFHLDGNNRRTFNDNDIRILTNMEWTDLTYCFDQFWHDNNKVFMLEYWPTGVISLCVHCSDQQLAHRVYHAMIVDCKECFDRIKFKDNYCGKCNYPLYTIY